MEYYNRKKKTKCEEFLDTMEEIIPWAYWVDMIRPYYFSNKDFLGLDANIFRGTAADRRNCFPRSITITMSPTR